MKKDHEKTKRDKKMEQIEEEHRNKRIDQEDEEEGQREEETRI